jgi:diguanylate cyclase (GGDEF)-like protein/PAS domain S-box-containing protein
MQRSPTALETRYILACGVATSITAAWAALLVLHVGGESTSRMISNVGLVCAAFAGAIGCLLAASRGDAHRRTWIFLACASISWGLGQLIWTAYDSYGEEVPFPSYADAGYLGLAPLAAIGLLLIPSAIQTLAGRIRTVIDGMMIAGAVFLCSWVVVLDQVYAAGDDGLFTTTISLAYPLGDVVLISIAMYVLLRGRERRDQIMPMWMIVLGLSAFAVADSAFAHLGAPAASGPGSVIVIGWFVCFVAIMLAGLRPPPVVTDRLVEPEDTRTLGLLLPYVAVGLALVTSSIEIVHTGQTDKVVSWCRMFIVAAMVVRQVLTLSENRSLTRHLEERLVELRGSEQRFQSLVQHSSDVVTVIDVDGIVLYQSESIDRVFGFPVDAVSGKSIKMLLDEESARQLDRAVREIAAESYGIRVLDLRVCKASGHLCQVEMTMTNLLNNPSVRGIVLNTRDVSERKMLEDQLVYSAFHDSLTTLANRALFRDRVEDTLETAGRDGIAVLFLDLDSFKQVNDLLGHASGDLLLVQVAERLRHSVRPGDTVARLGGDEFAVLLEGANDATAVDVAERITNALQKPFVVDGQEILVRGSLGLAIASADAQSADKLLRNADLAMYRAKAAGEGGFERYDPEMHVHLVERLQLEVDLRRAIEGNELVLHYQPIVEIATGRISGVETLVRWRHPTRGLLEPSSFIPIAEDSGLVVALGRWVLREASYQVSAWRSKHAFADLTISVNISAGQLRPGFAEQVAASLEAARLPPECLVLEMTESVLMDHTEENLAHLTAFREMGVRLAIDDFGTGFSSLSYLLRFPVDVLKIDRSFVDALSDTPTERALVATIIQLGRTLSMKTVAEGVETEAQARALLEMGCEQGQGFFFSRPLPASQFERLLEGESSAEEPIATHLPAAVPARG